VLELRASPPRADDCEVAGPCFTAPALFEQQRNTRGEERLADQQLAAAGDLDDYGVACDAALRTGGLCPCVRLN
jgi:hypothetical protein